MILLKKRTDGRCNLPFLKKTDQLTDQQTDMGLHRVVSITKIYFPCKVDLEMMALAINLAANKRNAQLICESNGLRLLMQRAFSYQVRGSSSPVPFIWPRRFYPDKTLCWLIRYILVGASRPDKRM